MNLIIYEFGWKDFVISNLGYFEIVAPCCTCESLLIETRGRLLMNNGLNTTLLLLDG